MTLDVHVENEPVIPAPRRRRAANRHSRRWSLLTVLALVWIAGLALSAIFANLLPLSPPDVSAGPSKLPPFEQGGELLLGTDRLGRSTLARIIYGARTSLTVGLLATTIGALLGGALGIVSGYFRGKVDAVLGALANMILSMPGLMLLLAISAVFTPGLLSLLCGLGFLAIPAFMRIARASTLTYAARDFVAAAKSMGARPTRIMLRELAPNVALPVLSYAFLLVAVLIAAEGALSYLGVGIPPPAPSWGGMIKEGQRDLRENPHLLFVPAIVMFFTVYALNIIGDAMRKRFNVKESQ